MINLGLRSMRGIPGQAIVSTDYYPFRGGLNLIDPFLSIQPGQLLATSNYEVYWRGGYRRVKGYERFDGQPAPSAAQYMTLFIGDQSPENRPLVGDTIDWGASNGVVRYVTSQGHLVIETPSENGPEIGNTIGLYGTVTEIREGDTGIDEENLQALVAVQEARRAMIQPVPGSGPIRGVAYYCGNVYAFRDNSDATECVMWKSSPTGWVQVTFNPLLRFTGGSSIEPLPGTVIEGESSGATATIRRVRTKTGNWALGTAAGYLSLTDVTGTFADGENLLIDSNPQMVADGTTFTKPLSPGGRYQFRISIFDQRQVEPCLYGVNGIDNAWEYDCENETFTPIETGMDPDSPKFIAVHNRMLFLSFRGGSVQNSAPNNPFSWAVVSGANELLVGGEVTGFVEEVNDALLIYTRDSVKVLYGQIAPEFNLVTLNNEMGAIAYTAERIGSTIHLDQRGISSVAATAAYGNFVTTDLSQLIKPILDQRMGDVFGAQIIRSLNLYRLFFNDGSAVVLGFHGNEPAGFTMIDYGKPVTALWSSQTEGGRERAFFGSEDGFVYEQDIGTSFDGNPIEAFALLVFYHSGSPEQNKRYRKAVLEMSGFQASIAGSIDVNYGGTGATGAVVNEIGGKAGGAFWNVGEWSEFKWSEGVGADPSFYIEDTGFNIGLHLYHKSAVEQEHVIHGINITWSPRRLKREF